MPEAGIDSVTVPGAVAGWNALHERFGRISWKDLFQSAIFYAENGYPVPEIIAFYWEDRLVGSPVIPRGGEFICRKASLRRWDNFFKIRIWRRRCDWWLKMERLRFIRATLHALF